MVAGGSEPESRLRSESTGHGPEARPLTHDAFVWGICLAGIGGVLFRPRGIAEWVWTCASAIALAVFGLVSPRAVAAAIGDGANVSFFLSGMMLLAELARREGVFDWVASNAVAASGGSRLRLFTLVYVAGIFVTIVLSNDATAVVLTPAVAAAVRDAKAAPLPHLFACAFVANAASFVLPISNPANLVVFAGAIPALPRWLATFTVPSLLAIAATFAVLAAISRTALRGPVAADRARVVLHSGGALAVAAIVVTAVVLLVASSLGLALGPATFACGATFVAIAALRDRAALREIVTGVSWTVLLLVAGLFVMVRAVETTDLLGILQAAIARLAALPAPLANVVAATATALVSNLTNNLPAGLLAGASVAPLHSHAGLRSAVAIGIDLGPNLSVTGSLATVLWLVALRREKIEMTAWTFLRAGALVMPPALLLAAASVSFFAR